MNLKENVTRTIVDNISRGRGTPDHSELQDYEERDGTSSELHVDTEVRH